MARAYNCSVVETSCPTRAALQCATVDEVRAAYRCHVDSLKAVHSSMEVAGMGVEEMAQELYQIRGELKNRFHALTPAPLLWVIYGRNRLTYGNILGPTYELLLKKGKCPADIIESATRSGGGDLGLTNPYLLAIIGWLDSWRISRDAQCAIAK